MAELNIDPKRFPVNPLMNRISQAKKRGSSSRATSRFATDPVGKVAARVYERLQERLRAANAFDFDDLLVYAYLLLKNHPEVLAAYQDRFRYLMVDEYQDTNRAQYEITMLLAAGHKNIMVVGDDDQSIYSWRGADLRNILEFESDFPEARTVKLEQNYRSVGNILAAANAVIANNQHRKEKRLFTDSGDGDKISVYMATDERDEGRWIAGEIEKKSREGMSYDDMAVFYRTNAQSRMLEDMLLRAGVPYRIVGGTRFFDRAEIRDVMAYLTLVVNPADDIAAKRVVNVPRRGIGKTTIERIDQYGREMDMPFLEAAELLIVDPDTRAATRKSVAEFVTLIKTARSYEGQLRRVIETIVDDSGLIGALQAENTDEARGRVENIKEFLSVVDEFSDTHGDDDAMYDAPSGEGRRGARARFTRRLPGGFHRVGPPAHRSGHHGRRRACRYAHDRPFVEGPRVRLRVRGGHGGVAVPPHELGRGRGGGRGGAKAGVRRHHARPQASLPHVRAAAPDLRPDVGESGVAFRERDPAELRRVSGVGSAGYSAPAGRSAGAAGASRVRVPRRGRAACSAVRAHPARRGAPTARARAQRARRHEPQRGYALAQLLGFGRAQTRLEGNLRRGGHRRSQDLRTRQGDQGRRRHAARQVREERPDEEAFERLRPHREDRLTIRLTPRCALAMPAPAGFADLVSACLTALASGARVRSGKKRAAGRHRFSPRAPGARAQGRRRCRRGAFAQLEGKRASHRVRGGDGFIEADEVPDAREGYLRAGERGERRGGVSL